MSSTFDYRNIIQCGTPQKLEEALKNKSLSEGELAPLMTYCFKSRTADFAGFLPILIK